MRIKITLTAQQMEQLKPLFDEAERKPTQGFVLGQAWDKGYAVFEWVTPEQVIKNTDAAVSKTG